MLLHFSEDHELLYSKFSQKLKPCSNQVMRDHIPWTPSPVRALRYAASVDTNVFPSPVFISAIDPSWRTAPPIIYHWYSQCKLNSVLKLNKDIVCIQEQERYLHIKMAHSKFPPRCFTNNSKCLCKYHN